MLIRHDNTIPPSTRDSAGEAEKPGGEGAEKPLAWGDGRLFRQINSRFWWAEHYIAGKRVRFSTKETERPRAVKVLQQRVAESRVGGWVPEGKGLTVAELLQYVRDDHENRQLRTIKNLTYPLRHLERFLTPGRLALSISTPLLGRYIRHRRAEKASQSSIRGELHYLSRGFKLAVQARRLNQFHVPFVPKLTEDRTAIRQGWISVEELDAIVARLDPDSGDLVAFLFWSAWRVSEATTLEWRDYDTGSTALRLRPEASKTKLPRPLPVAGEIRVILERRRKAKSEETPLIFHRHGGRMWIKSLRTRWHKAVRAAGLPHKLIHDLRRSGIKHLIESGVDQRRAMAFSGHRTASIFHRYQIVDVAGLHDAAEMAARAAAEKRAQAEAAAKEFSQDLPKESGAS